MNFKPHDNVIDRRTFRLISDLSDHETHELAEDFAIETEGYYALMPVTKTEYKQITQQSGEVGVKKMRIKSDEMYPMYSLEEVGDPKWFSGEIVEVDERFYKEFDEVETKFFKMQQKIDVLLKAGRLV